MSGSSDDTLVFELPAQEKDFQPLFYAILKAELASGQAKQDVVANLDKLRGLVSENPLKVLSELLIHHDVDVRVLACECMALANVESSDSELVYSALSLRARDSSEHPRVREAAVKALACTSFAVSSLCKLVSDPDVSVRSLVAASVPFIKDNELALMLLSHVLRDQSLDVRNLGVVSAGMLGEKAAELAPLLVSMLSSVPSSEVNRIQWALEKMGSSAVKCLQDAVVRGDRAASILEAFQGRDFREKLRILTKTAFRGGVLPLPGERTGGGSKILFR